MGIVGIGRDRTVDLRLGLRVAIIEDVDAAEDDARAHLGVVEAERLVRHVLRAAQRRVGDSAQPIETSM